MMWRYLIFPVLLALPAIAGPRVRVVVGPSAPPVERHAAELLVRELQTLFDADARVDDAPGSPEKAGTPADPSTAVILVGTPRSNPAIPADTVGKLSTQGHVLKSSPRGLLVAGGSPAATFWAAAEFGYHFGIRHLLSGDLPPAEKPAPRLDGIDLVLESESRNRVWHAFNGEPFGAEAWSKEDWDRLLPQLAKLKFTHVLVPSRLAQFQPLPVDGDSAGRTAFRGAKLFSNPEAASVLDHIRATAPQWGLEVLVGEPEPRRIVDLGGSVHGVLPRFTLQNLGADLRKRLSEDPETLIFSAAMPGDLDAAAHYVARAVFDAALTPEKAFAQFIGPVCGEGVAAPLWKGFNQVEKAAGLMASSKDLAVDVPRADLFLRHLTTKEPLPQWWAEVNALYNGAINEMYRANTRARGGGRPYILHHAKRLEFAVEFLGALESLHKGREPGQRAAAIEQATEGIYNALNTYADAARDPSDRGAIALLNLHGYRALLNAGAGPAK